MPFTPGDLIDGHYRVERRFAGGMGFVYIVYDEVVGKRFAIKQLPEKHARNVVMIERFRREASAWLLLDHHPHIVQAHSYHPRPEGPILILEYVDGPSLARLLRVEKRISPVQVVRYARQFCQAMHYAHTHVIPDRGVGVLHRDIKPGNILLSRGNQIKVTDFGLAKIEGDSRITGKGLFVGTVAYSPPEQLREAEAASRASDVYAFGAVLYQMLSARLPFRSRSVAQLCRAILHQNPPPLGELVEDLQPVLCGVVMRCLEKEPAARFSSFADLDDAIAGFEPTLLDRSDRVCSGCEFRTLRAVAQCPVCSSPMKAIRPSGQLASFWVCRCGRRLPAGEQKCTQCGQTRPDRLGDTWEPPISILMDPDVPLPVPPDLDAADSSSTWPVPIRAARPGESFNPLAVRRLKSSSRWPPDDSHHYLVELRRRGSVLCWRLERGGNTIGRATHMGIRLRDPSVAAYQLFLVPLPCGWVAVNAQQSKLNVNGRATRQRLLCPGDLLRVGKTWMAFIGPPVEPEPFAPIGGHWAEHVDSKQTLRSSGSAQSHSQARRAGVCILELPGGMQAVTRGEPLRIGRSPFCQLSLEDSVLAPVQAMVAWQDDGPHLFNLTGDLVKLVGGEQIADRLLVGGELLQVGSTPMKVHVEPAAESAVPGQSDSGTGSERFALTVLDGAQQGQTALLPGGEPMVLGRQPDCDLILSSDRYVSRHHLRVTAGESQVQLKDMGSRHGFGVNQQAFSDTAAARAGDVLVVGKTPLLVHYEVDVATG